MNTAYRVWDGEQMYYYGDEGICLSIGELGSIDGKVFGWSLWLDGYGVIAHSGDGKSVLMWGTGIRLPGQLVDPEKCIYAPGKMIYESDLILRYDYNPDVYMKDKFIGEVKMIEGSWCVVNVEKEISALLFSETAEDALFGNIYENVTEKEGAE
ncbi:hypothetical protein BG30_12465 [Bacillus subtilis subsp. subtilis]|nr:hypothetical protein BG30_12465 [Bacillus subtilis subsp. subtilis]